MIYVVQNGQMVILMCLDWKNRWGHRRSDFLKISRGHTGLLYKSCRGENFFSQKTPIWLKDHGFSEFWWSEPIPVWFTSPNFFVQNSYFLAKKIETAATPKQSHWKKIFCHTLTRPGTYFESMQQKVFGCWALVEALTDEHS